MDFETKPKLLAGSPSTGYRFVSEDENGTGTWQPYFSEGWLTSTSYTEGEIVSNDDGLYICTASHTSGASTEPGTGASWGSYWALMLQAGSGGGSSLNWRGSWATSTSYASDDVVENDGSSYVCISAHTSGASSEPGVGGSWATYWELLAEKGATGATGATGAAGTPGTSDLPRGTVVMYLDVLDGVAAESFSSDWIMLSGGTTTSDGSTWAAKTVPNMNNKFARGTTGTGGSSGGADTHSHTIGVSTQSFDAGVSGSDEFAFGISATDSESNVPAYITFEFWMKWRST